MTEKQKQIKQALEASYIYPDKVVCHRDGKVSVKKGYFYRHGGTSRKWADKVLIALKDVGAVELIDYRDDWQVWPKDSYFVAVVK